LQRGCVPGRVSGVDVSLPVCFAETHSEDVDAQGEGRGRVGHCALGAGLAAGGQARGGGGGAAVVVLEAGGERQLGGKCGPGHLG
jgi:uncharacterized Ntn-hydrolase superfamily protein